MIKKPIFKCGICGKEYSSVEKRMNCEATCLTELKKDSEKKKAEKLRQEKDARVEEINQAYIEADKKYNEAVELERKFEDDYNTIQFVNNFSDIQAFMNELKSINTDAAKVRFCIK